jgi:hypothetical protein
MLPPASSSLIDDGNQSFMYVGFPCQKWEVALLRETSTKEFAQEVQSIVYHVLEEILHGQRRLFCFLKLKGTYRSFVRRLVSGEGIGGEMLNTRMMLDSSRTSVRSLWLAARLGSSACHCLYRHLSALGICNITVDHITFLVH